MIDWLTFSIDIPHVPIRSGRLVKMTAEGELSWESPDKSFITGSFDDSIRIASTGPLDRHGLATQLWFDGNPIKFLQGHNVFGTDDIRALITAFLIDVIPRLISQSLTEIPLLISPLDKLLSTVVFFRIDINYSYRLGSHADVAPFLAAMSQSVSCRTRMATHNQGTVYLKFPKRREYKWYSKWDEAKLRSRGHRIKLPEDAREKLLEFAKGLIRSEVKLLSKELAEQNLNTLAAIESAQIPKIYAEYMKKLQFTERSLVTDDLASVLPSALRGTYALWRAGMVPRSILAPSTFARHKKALLSHGVNIDHPANIETNVIPLLRTLEATPASISESVSMFDYFASTASPAVHSAILNNRFPSSIFLVA